MPIYKQTTEITNIDDLLSGVERDIEEVYFGDKLVFTVWAEYDGTLPAQYTANGDYLADYRIYGASGGVGDRTNNLLNPDDIVSGYYIDTNFSIAQPTSDVYKSTKIYLKQGTYTISFSVDVLLLRRVINGEYINVSTTAPFTFTVSSDGFVGFSWRNSDNSDWDSSTKNMLTEGSTAPAEYVPYGYEVDMSVSDSTTSTTTPVYIGSDPLEADEYIDYDSGKIYRMSGGALTPTDPPVPLPALPTVDGTNIVDYAGQSAAVPARFVAKYRKEGF